MLLSDKEWKEFYISGIFDEIKRGKRLTRSNQILGQTPYISSSALNNGVDNFIGNTKNIREFSDCISLANSGSVGASFYHSYSFVASDHVTHLKNNNFNKYTYLFIAMLTNRLSEKYNFNREINDVRISREKILLPTNDVGEPDYNFMESYVKDKTLNKKAEYIKYAKKMVSSLSYKEISSLEEKKWESFKVLDIFDYLRGNQNNMNSLSLGDNMLISAKKTDNGLKGFYETNNSKKTTYSGHCITLNNDGDGGVGLAYYQPYKFLLDTHVYALYSKEKISKYAYLYITLLLSKQRICFSHGHSISKGRLAKMKIMLPTDKNKKPDYVYMEQYMKNLMLTKYKKYIDYHNGK